MAEITRVALNPLDDYFNHLLTSDGEVSGQHVNWDDLLHEAVSPYHLQEALASSTLKPGFAPLCVQRPGVGNDAQRHTQALHLLRYTRTLPAGRLRSYLLSSAQHCLGAGNG